MSLYNSDASYGGVAKLFHWVTAALILLLIPLGYVATKLAEATQTGAPIVSIDTLTTLFSIHKTLGVLVFFVALLRILWALSQPKPKLLHGDRRGEALAAETVHWLLYAALVLVPLTGWIHHAASTGFAPIWWPFGQSLPMVPQSESLSKLFSTAHFGAVILLVLSLGLHIAGALKHHVIDRDATLRRMLPGRVEAHPSAQQPKHWPSFALAVVVLAAGLTVGVQLLSPAPQVAMAPKVAEAVQTTETAAATPAADRWQVQDGQLGLNIRQLGNPVSGGFETWQAAIRYDPDASGPVKGSVRVEVDIASLTLGTVTAQALGADYFDSAQFPVAIYEAELQQDADNAGGQLWAKGQLVIKGVSVALDFPVTLVITDDEAQETAEATGVFSLDRRDFGIGDVVPDEGTLGFGVDLQFDLTATRG